MNQFAHGHGAFRAAWGFCHGYPKPHAAMHATRLDRACSVVISIMIFSSPLPSRPVHARTANANGLLAARDCAGVHEKRLLMRELAHGRARPRTIVTRTSAQRLIATEMDIRSRRSTRVQGLEKLRATSRSGLPGQGDGENERSRMHATRNASSSHTGDEGRISKPAMGITASTRLLHTCALTSCVGLMGGASFLEASERSVR
ncbi:hypothetical protein Q7P35_005248 [Cladosporium inversicolor]